MNPTDVGFRLGHGIRGSGPYIPAAQLLRVAAFKVRAYPRAFAAPKDDLSHLPHSGSSVGGLGDDLAGYRSTKGSLQFAVDQPLPDGLV
jgi:hypothetical protein